MVLAACSVITGQQQTRDICASPGKWSVRSKNARFGAGANTPAACSSGCPLTVLLPDTPLMAMILPPPAPDIALVLLSLWWLLLLLLLLPFVQSP